MLAAAAVAADPDQPLRALSVAEIEAPPVPDGWVEVEANHLTLLAIVNDGQI